MELPLMEDQEMIQAFSSHTSQKTFTDGIGSWSPVRRSKHLDATCCCHSFKIRPELAISIPESDMWVFAHMESPPAIVALPRDRWESAFHVHGSALRDFSSIRKKAKSGRKKRSVTCKQSPAHISAA
jgi:hypothetical protein